jgi:hypothetical protein
MGWLSLMFNGRSPAQQRAAHLASVLLHELQRLKFIARTKKGKLRTVQFDYPLLLTTTELWCPINLQDLPDGVRTVHLKDEGVLMSLSDRCRVPVRIDTLPNGKLSFVLRLGGSTFPAVFAINRFELPKDAPSLAIPIGVDSLGAHRWVDLESLPHLLGVGSTGKGKSNFVHSMLCCWLSRNTSDELELWLCDHKGGVELWRYAEALQGAKHRPGIVRHFSDDPLKTLGLLNDALREVERRQALLKAASCSDLREYASRTGQYLRRIVIVIDEIFELMLSKKQVDPRFSKKGYTVAQWAESLLAELSSKGRAFGIHLAIFTQKTGKDVLTSLITANFETRIVFSVSDMYQSIYVLGKADAVAMPPGRAVFRHDSGELEMVQTPRISTGQIRLILSRVARYGPDGGLGGDESRRFLAEAKLIVDVASQLGGDCARARILKHPEIAGVIAKERFEELAKRLEHDGILIPGGPRRPRRVAPGFLGRTALLDQIYGLDALDARPTIEPAVTRDTPDTPSAADTEETHPNQQNSNHPARPDMAYGRTETLGEDSEDLGPFRAFLDSLD